jgi:FkbM family methyltransferase
MDSRDTNGPRSRRPRRAQRTIGMGQAPYRAARTMRTTVRELQYWLPRFRRVTRHAVSRWEGVRQTVRFLSWFVGRKIGLSPRRTFVMNGTYGQLVVSDHTEMLVILEVLVDEGYAHPDLPDEATLVLDLGCNMGAAALWFGRRYPGARIVGVEANFRVAELARRNVAGMPTVRIIAAAVGERRGETTLWVNPESWRSSTAVGDGTAVSVPSLTLDDLIGAHENGVIVKIDIEGAEHAALKGATRLGHVSFITGEYHPLPGATWRTFVGGLNGFEVEPGADGPDERHRFTARRSHPVG